MRFDNAGLLWEDAERVSGRGADRVRPIPPIPDNGWQPPCHFPNLSSAKIISLDVETYDPHLMTKGAGWARNDGHIVGISLSVDRENSWYYPIRHTIQPELNLDPANVLRYVRDTLKTNVPKVGANLQYDIGWLAEENIHVGGMHYDVQFAEALLFDTASRYDLDAIAHRHLGVGKASNELYEWAAKGYGGKAVQTQRKNIYRCPPCLVGPYAEADAWEPLEILKKQWPLLQRANLLELFTLECKLIPILIAMRRRGLRVDLERVEEAGVSLGKVQDKHQQALDRVAGFDVNVYSRDDLQLLFDKLKIDYPMTEKGNASFTQTWLDAQPDEVCGLVNEVRKYHKAKVTFIENGIIKKANNGRLHPSFHPLRGVGVGAVSGRFASSGPNAQQIPSRDPYLGPLIRGLYIPDEGYPLWMKLDLSQIEYRCFAHYSEDEALIAEYKDPNVDFHEVAGAMLGGLLPRTIVKNVNFGTLYGMGHDKFVRMMHSKLNVTEVYKILAGFGYKPRQLAGKDVYTLLGNVVRDTYAKRFPAAKRILQKYSEEAAQTGVIRTVLNRRNTFDLWEPMTFTRNSFALPHEAAIEKYGYDIRRGGTHKALNRKLQGSAADIIKKGLVDAWEAGILDEDKLGAPSITVHDEFDFSYHPDLANYAQQFIKCIENAVPLKVPVIMDCEAGTNWGHVKNYDLNSNTFC